MKASKLAKEFPDPASNRILLFQPGASRFNE